MNYRVWFIRNSVSGVQTFEVPDWLAGRWFLDGMMSLDPRAGWVEAESCGMETFLDGEWAEWKDDRGLDIVRYIEDYNLNVRK